MSPYGKVPVVVVEGKAIFESAIINEYLDEVHPEPKLMPTDPFERAQARIWTDYVATRLVPPLYRVLKSSHPEKVERSWPELHQELTYLNHALETAGGPWLLGAHFSMADINLLPFVHQFPQLEQDVLSQYPAIADFYSAFQQRPSYQSTLQDL